MLKRRTAKTLYNKTKSGRGVQVSVTWSLSRAPWRDYRRHAAIITSRLAADAVPKHDGGNGGPTRTPTHVHARCGAHSSTMRPAKRELFLEGYISSEATHTTFKQRRSENRQDHTHTHTWSLIVCKYEEWLTCSCPSHAKNEKKKTHLRIHFQHFCESHLSLCLSFLLEMMLKISSHLFSSPT